jgi:hypothetical protein
MQGRGFLPAVRRPELEAENSTTFFSKFKINGAVSVSFIGLIVKNKVYPCTGTKSLYRPYGP